MGQMFKERNEKMNIEQFINESGYGWPVVKKPIYIPDADGNMQECGHRFMTTRINDDGSMVPFEAVSKGFQIIQNAEAFQFLTDLSDSGELEVQNILETQGGKQVIINTKIPEYMEIVGNSVATYIAFINNHGGGGSAIALAHNMQLCCTNQLTALKLSKEFRYSIRHSKNAVMKLEDARQAMSMAFKQTEELANVADRMATEKFNRDSYNYALRSITGLDRIDKNKQPRAYRRAEGARQQIHAIVRDADYIDGYRTTPWGLFQGVTDYVSNVERTKEAAGNRFVKMASGHPMTNRAYDLLTA